MYPADAQALTDGIVYIHGSGVHGDVIEFGVHTGRTAAILAEAMAVCEKRFKESDGKHGIAARALWLFDSFDGFPEASGHIDPETPHIKADVWVAGTPWGGTPEEVMVKCAAFLDQQRVYIAKGWYKDTLLRMHPEAKFGFVHIDCDYYESTFEVLDKLFGEEMISDGCAMYFDDWYCNRGSPKYGEQRAWFDIQQKYFKFYRGTRLQATDWGPYGIVGRRFIIHVDE